MRAGRQFAWDGDASLEGRTPVLAVGSNLSPAQIARKFPVESDGAVPVLRVDLNGFDSVYSAHITQYASIPATLVRASGVTVSLGVTWLTDAQLTRMHATEIPGENYRFAHLENLDCHAVDGKTISSLFAYISTRGHIVDNKTPIPLAEIHAKGRVWSAKSQPDIQAWVANKLDPALTTDAFIDANLQDSKTRVARMNGLVPHAKAFEYKACTVVDV